MTFEVDLIKYVINLAIVRGMITTSKDLNSDWLPFSTVLDVFDEVCIKLGVSKVVEDKCYKTILKMCSNEEKHLTWAYKVENIPKYFPLRTATHAEMHTSSSWNRHRKANYSQYSETDTTPSRRPYSSKKSHRYTDAYADFGLNLGTIRALNGTLHPEPPHYSPNQDVKHPVAHHDYPRHIPYPKDYVYDREGADKSPLYGFSLLAASPTLPPAPPSLYDRSERHERSERSSSLSTPPGKVSFSHTTPSRTTPAPSSYYRDYIPSSRISPIAHTNSPYVLSSALKSTRSHTHSSTAVSSGEAPHPTLLINTLNESRFAEEELVAMKERVESIELEAKKTRQLLSHIAYLKSRSPSASQHGSPNGARAHGGEGEGPVHHRHVEYGEIGLSPYLKEVLHLPPAVVLTDTYDTAETVHHDLVGSPGYGHTPLARGTVHPFTASSATRRSGTRNTREERSSPSPRRSLSPSPADKRSSSSTRKVRGAERELERGRARSHSREDVRHRFSVDPSPPVSPSPYLAHSTSRSSHSASRTTSQSTRSTQVHRYEQQHQRSPVASPVRAASPGRADFTSTLNQSPAMRKYVDYLHAAGRPSAAESPRSRSPSPARVHGHTLQELSSRLSRSAEKASSPPADRYAMYSSNERSSIDSSFLNRSGRSRSPPQFRTAQMDALLHLLHSKDPSPAVYHNSCRTQHTDELDTTIIDSSIDDLLGDSLNIEEKDGRVYVNFQSRFVL